jgi:tRNA nucleotidyltransferase/poly(A) polymerase
MSDVRPIAPGAVRWIARTLEEAGYETWAVGGAVRDALLGRPSVDWDLATRATPKQVRRTFRRTVPIGIDHGTVGVLSRDGVMYEVTTFRKDVETDGRHAVVEFADRIEDDLSRRDFTINAIAWHPLRDELFDPFGGVEDLAAAMLRTVGVAADRFREDYLRILRALRFAGRFDFEIHEGTWTALISLTDHLSTLSPERVREELTKVLSADPRPSHALSLYRDGGINRVLFPELDDQAEGVWEKAIRVVDSLPPGRPMLRLAALLRPAAPAAAAALLVRLRLSNADTDAVADLASAPGLPAHGSGAEDLRLWLSRHGPTVMRGVARLDLASARVADDDQAPQLVVQAWRAIRAELRTAPPLVVGDLTVDGRDLMRMGLKPGPVFKDVLSELLGWVLEDPARNQREGLLLRAQEVAERLLGDASSDASEGASAPRKNGP